MRSKQNFGPCAVINCTYTNVKYRVITEVAFEKCYKKRMLEIYPYLRVGKQLCHPHYCKIIESDRNKQKQNLKKLKIQKKRRNALESIESGSNNNINFTFGSSIEALTKVLYHQQRREHADIELDPVKFESRIENADPQLKGFFNSMVNAIIPKERSAYNINEAKKSIVSLCYMMAGLRNKFVNRHKLEVGLYLIASGATWEAIDIMASLGYSVCVKTVDEFRKKIQIEHVIKIEQYFIEHKNLFHVYNVDDYHSIHENRRPDTVSTSTANHFATFVAKPILGYSSVPLYFNNISVHNPAKVEAHRICWYLLHKYKGIFDISYLDYQSLQGHLIVEEVDKIEALLVHHYADNLIERGEERSMKELKLVGFREQSLHSVQDYVNILDVLLLLNNKTQHLDRKVAPVVADWPEQIFIRKALHMHEFSQKFESFLPMLGPLHLSLNSRKQVVLVHHSFFEKLFHFVFGKNKKFAKKPRPWRINLLLELSHSGWLKIRDNVMKKFGQSCKDIEYRTAIDLLDNLIPTTLDVYAVLLRSGHFEEYVESVFHVWTFFLRWKRKNYNKALLVFLSDLFYWMDTEHPFLNVLQKYLPSFNEYYVENTHSRIRANTSSNATADNIIKQAYVIMNHDLILKNTYCKTRHYPYNAKALDFLSNKTSLFLLQYFQTVFYNHGKSTLKVNTTTSTTTKSNSTTTKNSSSTITKNSTTTTKSSTTTKNSSGTTTKNSSRTTTKNSSRTTTKSSGTNTIKSSSTTTTKKSTATKSSSTDTTKSSSNTTTKSSGNTTTKKSTATKSSNTNTTKSSGTTTTKKKKQPQLYKLATLDEEVDVRRLPTAYSTSYPPHPDLCNFCKLPITDDNGVVLVCSHGYHTVCYSGRCIYCEEFYKKGIFKNINAFLKRIEKGSNSLTKDDLDDNENEEDTEEKAEEVEEIHDILSRLAAQMEQIKYW